jgi:alpha-tubulin suppressor-like RCC1 family protein
VLQQVLAGEMETKSGYLENINDISAGWKHSLALDKDGFVWSWGHDTGGILGNGIDAENKSTPVRVLSGEQSHTPHTYLKDIVDMAAGRSGIHSLAVSSDGYCWASGGWRQQLVSYKGLGGYSRYKKLAGKIL